MPSNLKFFNPNAFRRMRKPTAAITVQKAPKIIIAREKRQASFWNAYIKPMPMVPINKPRTSLESLYGLS